jgi:hypothetical protein
LLEATARSRVKYCNAMFALAENKEINKVERLNVDKYLDYSF